MYSLYQFFIYLSVIVIIFLTAFVFFRNKATTNSYLFCALSSSFLLWLISYAVIYSTEKEQIVYWLGHLGFIGIILIPFFAAHFLFNFINIKIKKHLEVLIVMHCQFLVSMLFLQNEYHIVDNNLITEVSHILHNP